MIKDALGTEKPLGSPARKSVKHGDRKCLSGVSKQPRHPRFHPDKAMPRKTAPQVISPMLTYPRPYSKSNVGTRLPAFFSEAQKTGPLGPRRTCQLL